MNILTNNFLTPNKPKLTYNSPDFYKLSQLTSLYTFISL
jgi:hypothetical protein